MNKQEITSRYNRLKHAEKCAVTEAALDYLADDGIMVARNTLYYWRNTPHSRSPLDGKYLEAFQYAFKTMQPATAAQPI